MTIIAYFVALNISFLLLHNALGKKDDFDGPQKSSITITLIASIALIVLMTLFVVFVVAIVIV